MLLSYREPFAIDMTRLTLMALLLAACASTPPRPDTLGKRPIPAGTTRWEAAVRAALRARYDDGSGVLGGGELMAVPCGVWRELDGDLRRDTHEGLAITYGFEPRLLWRGERLGLAADARATALELTTRCLGPSAQEPALDQTLQALMDLTEPITTDAWDQSVATILVRTFDRDQSGRLDLPEEVEAIPCSVWSQLDGAVATVSRYPMVALYGFADGYAWAAGALGFDLAVRDEATVALGKCGIRADL